MKAGIFFFFFFTLLLVVHVEAEPNEQLMREIERFACNAAIGTAPGCREAIVAAIRHVCRSNRCTTNICFAMDGSRQIGVADFELQLHFVAIVTLLAGIDESVRFSGTQYGLRNSAIRNNGSNDTDFLLSLEKVRYMRSRRSFIGTGVSYCFQQLNRRRGEPAKMIILADGRSSSGGPLSGPLSPAALAANFRSRSPNNTVCAVAVGFSPSRTDFFDDFTEDPKLVLKVTEWHRILQITVDLMRIICPVGRQPRP